MPSKASPSKRSSAAKKEKLDPDGFVSESFKLDNELNPFLGPEDQQDEEGESELLHDTFTFLMTARYPFQDICRRKDRSKRSSTTTTKQATQNNDQPTGKEAATNGTDHNNASDTTDDVVVDSDANCLPFLAGFFIIGAQLFIYAVVMANIFQSAQIPPNADTWLRLAQIFAVIVTLYTQSDFIDGIFLITEGWKAFYEISTPIKFNFSALMRVLAGNIGIAATFILVMYSTEVVDLLLNFTAMEFVATLDDSAFELASKGFLGTTLETKCLEIQDFRYIPHPRKRRSCVRVALYVFYVLLVFGAFFVIVSMQANRVIGVDNEVYIQFDDTRVSEFYGISGVYFGCQGFGSSATGKIGYIRLGRECPELLRQTETKAKIYTGKTFVYCWDLDGFVYIEDETTMPCDSGNYLMRSLLDEDSITSNSFDILTHAKANWVMSGSKTKFGGETLTTDFLIESIESLKPEFRYCGNTGTSGLINLALRMDLLPAETPGLYDLLPTGSKFYPDMTDPYGTTWSYLDRYSLVYRPIYHRNVTDDRYQVVYFDGLRWNWIALNPREFARTISKEQECDYEPADPDCWRVFVKYFHSSDVAWRSDTSVVVHLAISDPMMFLSPEDTGMPTSNLGWYRIQLVDDRIEPGIPFSATSLMESFYTHNYLNDLDRLADDDYHVFVAESTAGPIFECNEISVDLGCDDDQVSLFVEVATGQGGWGTTVLMFDRSFRSNSDLLRSYVVDKSFAGDVVWPFSDNNAGIVDILFDANEAVFQVGACFPKDLDRCFRFVIMDSGRDGILLPRYYRFQFGDGEIVDSRHGGYQLWSCRSYYFGPGCTDEELTMPIECNTEDMLSDNFDPNNLPSVLFANAQQVDSSLKDFLGPFYPETDFPTSSPTISPPYPAPYDSSLFLPTDAGVSPTSSPSTFFPPYPAPYDSTLLLQPGD